MGLFKKVKDILFDEEEVIESNEEKIIEHKRPEPPKTIYNEVKEVKRSSSILNEESQPLSRPQIKEDQVANERPLYKNESAFPFPDFDEDEFDNVRPKSKTTNVMEYERNRRKEKKSEYSRLEKVEVPEKKKFKPSPIISPVYGILNEDYVADDITNRNEETAHRKSLDVESVRKKAFGSLDGINKTSLIEETETVTSYEPPVQKEQKVKTIDELLEDTSDVKIDLDDTEELIPPILDEEKKETMISKETIVSGENNKADDDDTLENDLFDLIDSMYDTKEDGE